MVRGGQNGQSGKIFQLFFMIDNFHRPAAENEGWPYDHRITNGLGHLPGFGNTHGNAVGRLDQPQLVEHGLKQLPVLGTVDAIRMGSQNGYAGLGQRRGQIQAVFVRRTAR